MIQENKPQGREKKVYKVLLILLIAMAALSGARKDLNQLLSLANEAQAFADHWFGGMLPSVQARTISHVESCTAAESKRINVSTDDFRWSGRVAEGKAVEIKGISGNISAEPARGDEVEVVAIKSSNRSDTESVKVQLVEHPDGVTICALYPTDDPSVVRTCEPGRNKSNFSSGANIRNNDVRVDFTVRVPAGVSFVGKTINGEIKAASLAGNVFTHTVNGSIQISTSGYAQAKTVNGSILASMGNSSWPDAIEFKTVNGGITLDLPAALSTKISAETFNGQISSDFPVNVVGTVSRKQLTGTIGAGGRELVIKTLNGSINLRRAG
jgi:Putative adhesin